MRPVRPLRPMLPSIALLCCLSGTAAGQSYWHDDAGEGQLRFELLKPLLRQTKESFFTGAGFLSASVRAGSAFRVEAELPVARGSFTAGPDIVSAVSDFQVGNPYLGVVWRRGESRFSGRIGARAPLVEPSAVPAAVAVRAAAMLSDPDRLEAFFPDLVTVRGAVEWQKVRQDGLLLGAVLGPSLLINEGDGVNDSVDLMADYGIRIGYRDSGIQGTGAITGRILVTEPDASRSERVQHQLTGALGLRRGVVRPEFLARLPLDTQAKEAARLILGAGVRVVF